jgi:hypothetical protein
VLTTDLHVSLIDGQSVIILMLVTGFMLTSHIRFRSDTMTFVSECCSPFERIKSPHTKPHPVTSCAEFQPEEVIDDEDSLPYLDCSVRYHELKSEIVRVENKVQSCKTQTKGD